MMVSVKYKFHDGLHLKLLCCFIQRGNMIFDWWGWYSEVIWEFDDRESLFQMKNMERDTPIKFKESLIREECRDGEGNVTRKK
jgi:hypothetical protein